MVSSQVGNLDNRRSSGPRFALPGSLDETLGLCVQWNHLFPEREIIVHGPGSSPSDIPGR